MKCGKRYLGANSRGRAVDVFVDFDPLLPRLNFSAFFSFSSMPHPTRHTQVFCFLLSWVMKKKSAGRNRMI